VLVRGGAVHLEVGSAVGEGDCSTPSVDEAKVIAAPADIETHSNVNRRGVILGGYSSGGDLAYRTGFRHSSSLAGLPDRAARHAFRREHRQRPARIPPPTYRRRLARLEG
jgi:poly(3-hydroxybutyrate) depolymerase